MNSNAHTTACCFDQALHSPLHDALLAAAPPVLLTYT
jgi:hypothetical protein